MSIMPDHWIARMAREQGMIEPFEGQQVRNLPSGERVISYGLSSYGYDIRVAEEFKIFTPNPYNTIVDPKSMDPRVFYDFVGKECIIPPNSYLLCRSLEYFRIPEDVLVLVLGKSTYARSGLIVNVTPGEPGWEGHWTIEISNSTGLPAKVYANEGIAQCLFMKGDMRCSVSYKDRNGKYQGQIGVTLPKIE
jgi:dCTP deaminase